MTFSRDLADYIHSVEYNGTNTIFGDSTSDALGAEAGSVTISTGNSGVSSIGTGRDDLVIENDGNAGVTIATPNTSTGFLTFADPEDNAVAGVHYVHVSDEMRFKVNGTTSVLVIESDGTLNVSGTTDYETLVTADDDIPNRKYVHDNFAHLNVANTFLVNNTFSSNIVVNNGGNTPATAGAIRLNNNNAIQWRNQGNTANLGLAVNTDDALEFDGNIVASTSAGSEITMIGDDGFGKGIQTEWDATNTRFRHRLTFNDGGGNFNIRIGHLYNTGSPTGYLCTEASYPIGMTFVQSTGRINFNFTSTTKAVGDTGWTWDDQYVLNRDEFDFLDHRLTQAELKDYGETTVTATGVTGATTIDLTNGNVVKHTLSGNTTYTFSNPPASGTAGSFTLIVTKGAHAITWPGSVAWPDGTAPTLGTGTNILTFVTTTGGTSWAGMFAGKDFA